MTPERSERIPGEPEPDAVAKGWVVPPGGSRVEAIFVLSGTSLGIGRVERATTPVWLDLRDLDNLDAIGDPVDGLTEVEIRMHDDRVIGAGWTDAFCEAVVAALQATAPGAPPAPTPSTAVPSTAVPAASPDTASADAASPDTAPAHTASPDTALSGAPALAEGSDGQVTPFAAPPEPDLPPVATEPEPSPADPGPGAAGPAVVTGSAAAEPAAISATGLVPVVPAAAAAAATPVVGAAPQEAPATPPAAALELEDVVYLGGYPGQTKRRKKCIVSMSRSSLELKGPSDLHFRIGWDVVRTIEVQNADEARFRMNTKIHRDASALVLECDQGVTVLLEARDCPTVALRSAINQLLDGLPVVVV